MYQKILIPLDGSPFAERVLAHIRPFITPHHTSVLLLRVVERTKVVSATGPLGSLASLSAERLWEEAEGYLRAIQGELRAMGITAECKVVAGDVTSTICESALAHDADLIAMATHGRSGVSRWALGSVADHVVRVCPLPILLVRASAETMSNQQLRQNLVPLDGSLFAEQALDSAQALAQENGASLLLVRSIDLKSERELDGMLEEVEGGSALRAHRARAARLYLDHVQEQLHSSGVCSHYHLMYTPPAPAILKTASQEEVDLIVMSTHARSMLGRWVYGSVADKVARDTTCPLLLVRASDARAYENGSSGELH
ncbi:MAG: universal stress protein [Ardenticatenales bacterium]|nr:universal stress protein [Ardenticatenales bacterium]